MNLKTRKYRRVGRFSAGVIACCLLVGCSDATDEIAADLVPVSGQVRLAGAPSPHVVLYFTPLDEGIGAGGYAVTEANGAFLAKHRSGYPGLNAGTYAVSFSKLAQPDGSAIPEGASAADFQAQEVIPAAYSNPEPERPRNVITVSAEGGEFEFDVPVK